jgi:hypothetical protein
VYELALVQEKPGFLEQLPLRVTRRSRREPFCGRTTRNASGPDVTRRCELWRSTYRDRTPNQPPSLRPFTPGLYISSACAGGRTNLPAVVARAM